MTNKDSSCLYPVFNNADKYVTGMCVSQFYYAAQRIGIEVDRCANGAGINVNKHLNPLAKIPLKKFEDFIGLLMEENGSFDFGYKIGKELIVSLYSSLLLACASGNNVIACITKFQSLQRLVLGNAAEFLILNEDKNPEIRADTMLECTAVRNQCLIASSMFFVSAIRELTCDPGWAPKSVMLATVEMGNENESLISQFIGCDVKFNSKFNSVEIDCASAEGGVVNVDTSMSHVANSMAIESLQKLFDPSLVESLQLYIKESMPACRPTLFGAAKYLQVSQRTLYRKLEEAGTHWQKLLDNERKKIAFQMLNEGKKTYHEISDHLSFGSVRSFQRRFKSWTGITISEYVDKQR